MYRNGVLPYLSHVIEDIETSPKNLNWVFKCINLFKEIQ